MLLYIHRPRGCKQKPKGQGGNNMETTKAVIILASILIVFAIHDLGKFKAQKENKQNEKKEGVSTGIKIIIGLIVLIFVPFPIWLPLLVAYVVLKAISKGTTNILEGIQWAYNSIKEHFTK